MTINKILVKTWKITWALISCIFLLPFLVCMGFSGGMQLVMDIIDSLTADVDRAQHRNILRTMKKEKDEI